MPIRNVSLNLNVRGLGTSATLAINEKSTSLRNQGKTVYKLGLGQSPFPVPDVVVDALREHAHEKDYLPVTGLPQLRKAVAEYHQREDNVDNCAECVLIGPGSKELMFILQLVYYGEIILPTPCWVSYGPQAKIIGRNVRFIHTSYDEKWRLSPERLVDILESENDTYRPRLLVLNYPGNPDGDTYRVDELQRIAEVAREYEMILLSDEIYGRLQHSGEHVSVASFYPEGTIISSGLSKWCGAGGWRLGTFTFPKELKWLQDAMAAVASETYTSVSAPIQFAATRAFQGGSEIDRYLQHVRRILAALGNKCSDLLKDAGVRVQKPTGAFYLFTDFSPLSDQLNKRGISSSQVLCEKLLDETGVAILPGLHFERPAEELSARLAYVNFDGVLALDASESIPIGHPLPDTFLERLCPDTLEAIGKLCSWISGVRG